MPRGLRHWLNRRAPELWVAEYSVPANYLWPHSFSVHRYRGLVACELHRIEGRDNKIVALWRNEEALKALSETLAADLAATPIETRFVVDAVAPPPSTKPGDVVLKASALIGAFTVVGALFSSLFAFPDIAISLRDVEPVNASVGVPVTFQALILNNSRSVASDISVNAETAERSLPVNTRRMRVAGGGQYAIDVTAQFRQAGVQRVTLTADASAGRLIPASRDTLPVGIKVWPQYTYSKFVVQRENMTPRSVLAVGTVTLGLAGRTRIECAAVAPKVDEGTRFLSASPSIDGGGKPNESQGSQRTIKVQWKAEVPGPYEPYSVRLALDGSRDYTSGEWERLVETIYMSCEVIRWDVLLP